MALHRTGRSGILRLERRPVKKQLMLQQNLLAFSESNVSEEHLARIMARMNLIPGVNMKEISSLMKTGKTTEEAIIAVSNSDTRALEKGRHEQAVIILASLLGWNDYEMHFYPGEELVRPRLSLRLALPELLVVAARRAVSDHLIPLPSRPLRGTVSKTAEIGAKEIELQLRSSEDLAYSRVQSTAKIEDILPLIPSGDSNPEDLVLVLCALGLIQLETDPAESCESGSAPELNPLELRLDERLQKFEVASLYEILSVSPEASHDDIQASYHDLARQFHPDRFQSKQYSAEIRDKADRLFTYATEAYRTLSDPSSRASYDKTRSQDQTGPARKSSDVKNEREQGAEALFRAARRSLANGDLEKAAEQLSGCAWLCPEQAKYQHYLGVAQSEIPRLRKKAEQHLLKAIELDRTRVRSYLALGKLYSMASLPRKAASQFQEALRWDPENLEAQTLLRKLNKKLNDSALNATSKIRNVKRLFWR